MARCTHDADLQSPIALVIACAGISGEHGPPGEEPSPAEWIYRVNVLGVLNTVEPLLAAMRRRRRGQIGLVASVAGFRGFPRGPAYSGSKAAIIMHGQAWREVLSGEGIGVSVICPGYLRTAMTARHGFPLPFALDPDRAAARIAAGLARNQARIVIPWPMPIVAWLFRALPASWTRMLIPGPKRP
jgi:short-subunit dehydrogenase